jgi:hypothetical protein
MRNNERKRSIMRGTKSKLYRCKIEKQHWRPTVMASFALPLLISVSMAAEPSDHDKARLQKAVLGCFMVPAGATTSAIIEAHFEDGKLKGVPKVVSKGDGPLNEAFAQAGVRAILKCEAKIAVLPIDGDVRFNFTAETAGTGVTPDTPKEVAPKKLSPGQQPAHEKEAKKIENFLNERRISD